MTFHVWLLLLNIVFKVYPHCSMCQCFIPFCGWIIFHCMDRSHSVYPFTCWWIFGLFPTFEYYKKFCCEQVSTWVPVFNFLDIYPEVLMNHIVILCLTFCFPQRLYHFTLPHAMYKGSNFSTSSPALVILYLKNESHPGGCEVVSHCGFHVLSPNDWECGASFHVLVGHLYVFLG